MSLLQSSAFGAALVFGFRHGFDWDHLAALTDLTGSQATARRSMRLATSYALGHGAMVVVLGAAAIVFAERLPDGVDVVSERLVGLTLIALGVWMAWTAARTRGVPPLRSRWMVLIGGLRRLVARWGSRRDPVVVIEHAHPHGHHAMHEHSHGVVPTGAPTDVPTDVLTDVPTDDPTGAGHRSRPPVELGVQHSHVHRHIAVAPADPFIAYGGWSSFGVGVLHGVGAETPTQLLVFAAAMQTTGRAASLGLLGCFVVGILASNTLVAAATTFGFRRVVQSPVVAGAFAVVTATFSVAVGSLLLLGHGAALPAILGG